MLTMFQWAPCLLQYDWVLQYAYFMCVRGVFMLVLAFLSAYLPSDIAHTWSNYHSRAECVCVCGGGGAQLHTLVAVITVNCLGYIYYNLIDSRKCRHFLAN